MSKLKLKGFRERKIKKKCSAIIFNLVPGPDFTLIYVHVKKAETDLLTYLK